MGFYYGPSSSPEPEKEPGGCMEALILTRVALSVLAVPILVLFGAVVGIAAMFYLFSVHWSLGLLFILALFGAIALYARWERSRYPSGPKL